VIPNLSCLMLVPAHDGRSPAVGLVGAPDYTDRGPRRLAMASDELHEIADTYGAARVLGGRIVAGAAATEGAFRALATRTDAAGATLHVVCHGDFVAEEPLYSGLLLVDGKIDAAEIARLRLGYDEVVLSACSSGHRATAVDGVPLSGDDVVGLVGAFLEAGTRAVVVSITRARDDASHAFMTTYHAHRAAGSTPAVALRETQRTMQQNGTYAASLWAGFVVYGS
jgi:CHAT domain-containing protein